jgi:hypothetical protein
MGVQAKCKVCMAETRKPGITAEREAARRLLEQGLKRCGVCYQVKLRTAFNVRKPSPDGLAYKCAECAAEYGTGWRKDHPDAFKKWYLDHVAERSQAYASWREANKDHVTKKYAQWARANKHIVNAIGARRMAAKFRATPAWANFDAIRAIYKEAAWLTELTDTRHEVDHIYPLQGKTVCGLHCEANLQILTKTENIRKSNRVPELRDHGPERHQRSSKGVSASNQALRCAGA